ncbi:hypothetical protein [Stakelama marina]|uniref:Uncharacterized protein n=1 Tax=Stakelama marina TaxID=2826939 RepID=A0A8T4IAI0_9SPHN|nr:hypothetical protein [Stakelama marina]MBR0551383.1 hypothetical protein [Stakelama marina]
MLAGLIFATEESDDAADTLAATLPFGGMTLLEYQARLLIAAGVGHILVAVGRVTPALLGAVSRIGKRDIAVDVVRSAEEAAAKAHPLANLIILADGLVTTDGVVHQMAGEAPDALLVTVDEQTPASVERVDSNHCWAGVALISAARLGDIAALPREYDFQSSLLRVCVQEGARQVLLPSSAKRAGHGVERDRDALASRSNAVLAALANQRTGWADRYIFTPITRLALPWLVRRSVPDWAVIGAGALLSVASLTLFGFRFPAIALCVALLAVMSLSTGSLLSWLRGDDRPARWQEGATIILCGIAVLAAGADESLRSFTATAAVLAAVTVAVGTMVDRMPGRKRVWYGSATAYLLLVTPFAVGGLTTIGLGVTAAYALLTMASSVEQVREKA